MNSVIVGIPKPPVGPPQDENELTLSVVGPVYAVGNVGFDGLSGIVLRSFWSSAVGKMEAK